MLTKSIDNLRKPIPVTVFSN